MIYSISGKIVLKKEKFIVLESNGIGYKVFLSRKSISQASISDKEIKVFCFLNVRENGIELYGFLTQDELELFEILEQIRGIGPKAALEISSLGPLDKIKEKILSQDEGLFYGIPGIGKKKAMAIILELSGRIKSFSKKEEKRDEAEDALIGLGFSRARVKDALDRIPKDIEDLDEKIKEALKILGS
ncbi:MAG: Holliday junction branch migration protein RuvA [Candidatus Pacebacteria bacterium]|nr:Holliday junction branch migration protein RuvA [Candidatus Paceibacterota bacterium]